MSDLPQSGFDKPYVSVSYSAKYRCWKASKNFSATGFGNTPQEAQNAVDRLTDKVPSEPVLQKKDDDDDFDF
jgi:hypothetical protein